MNTTLEQCSEATVALLSGMITTALQKEWKIPDHLPAQPASLLLDASLVKPTAANDTRISQQDITRTSEQAFCIDDSVLDLGPDHESDTSSDDDEPIRNPRQLKSEIRRVKAILRRANRRAARRATRITRHLSPT
jgi:hypothetical protein